MSRLEALRETLTTLGRAAERLATTHAGVAALLPLTSDSLVALSEPDRERLDAYAIRYARCQDLLYPSMRALARAQLEPAVDRGLLERFGLVQKHQASRPTSMTGNASGLYEMLSAMSTPSLSLSPRSPLPIASPIGKE